jgi:hypothetical protein
MKNCKGELSVVFLKPVGLKSDKTKRTDKTVKQLAIDYDMTDIKTTREGEHQTGYLKRHNQLSDKQFAEAEINRLRKAAEITYINQKFAPSNKDSNVEIAKPEDTSKQSSASEPSAPAPAQKPMGNKAADHIEKGISGL